MLIEALLLLAAAQPSPAPPPPPPPACREARHRQLDFWVGDWDVFLPDGKLAGRNTITREFDDCVVQEHWTGAKGMTGSSFNLYDAATGRWHQTWVDSGGTFLQLSGALEGNVMALDGVVPGPAGTVVQHALRLEPLGDGRVRQLWRTSTDGGKTWAVVFDGTYVRRKAD